MAREHLYWLVSAALNNSLKHAKARKVTISFEHSVKNFAVSIVDDGLGFDVEHVRAGGFGFQSMCEHARLMGGTLTVQSTLASGTRIFFQANQE